MRRLEHRRSAVFGLVLATLGLATAAATAAEPGHLRFFHQNRAFVLQAYEKLPHHAEPPADATRSWDFDPFQNWSATRAVAQVQAGLDSARSPRDLERFRADLDSLLQATAVAASRLDELDATFRSSLRTAVEVTLGTASAADITRVVAALDGVERIDHEVTPEERAALRAGGVLEVLRTVLEPRAQRLELQVWAAGSPEPSTFEETWTPVPDRLTRWHLEVNGSGTPKLQRTTIGEGE